MFLFGTVKHMSGKSNRCSQCFNLTRYCSCNLELFSILEAEIDEQKILADYYFDHAQSCFGCKSELEEMLGDLLVEPSQVLELMRLNSELFPTVEEYMRGQ